MDQRTTVQTPSLEAWNSRLNIHGEFLLVGCISCFSAPMYFDFAFLACVAVAFWFKVRLDRIWFPPSSRDLRQRVKDGTGEEVDPTLLAEMDQEYFSWEKARRQVPVYIVGIVVWSLTLLGLFMRDTGMLSYLASRHPHH